MRALKAVVFDLDGTLVDSAPDLQAAVNRLLAVIGRPPLGLEAVTMMIGDGAAKLVERAVKATGGLSPEDDVALLTQRFLGIYEGHTVERTRPYPGVPELLARLRVDGLALGICTNKPEAPTRELLHELHLDGHFSAVFGGDSLDGVRKPDPRLLQAVLAALDVGAAEAVMVGDNANDVQVARAAGVPVILRAGGYTRVPAEALGADLVIDDLRALPEALGRLS